MAHQVGNGTHEIVSDTTPDKGGANLGLRPHELFASALASCMQMTLRMVAQQRGFPPEEARVEVDLRRERVAATFVYRIELEGPLDERARAVLLAAAERCPVRQTLSGELRFEGR